MLRRLHKEQPESFAFTDANARWAEGQISKYPEGRQASAVIPLLWRAQEQEGWLSRPAIEHVADMLGMPYIRALEVATFYFMFQLAPVGSVAHVQVCGTTSCMICGAEDLIAVCKEKIAPHAFELSADGKFSWEEVECLGACTNAPMVQIGKDYYEDLTAESFAAILDAFGRGEVPVPGPQNGRFASEPLGGITTLKDFVMPDIDANGSVALAKAKGDTVARITGDALPAGPRPAPVPSRPVETSDAAPSQSVAKVMEQETIARPDATPMEPVGQRPAGLDGPRGGKADDLKRVKGIGPKLESLLNSLGYYHFDQIAAWTDAELAWVDANLEGFKGRASRDEWIVQARDLAASDD